MFSSRSFKEPKTTKCCSIILSSKYVRTYPHNSHASPDTFLQTFFGHFTNFFANIRSSMMRTKHETIIHYPKQRIRLGYRLQSITKPKYRTNCGKPSSTWMCKKSLNDNLLRKILFRRSETS